MFPRVLAPLLLCVALALVVGGAPTGASDTPAQAVAGFVGSIPSDDGLGDPFPIRRIRATEAQLPDLLKQVDPGPLVRLPRAEFESRVRAAGRAAADERILPRITDTRFKAALVGGDLVGTAEFDIVNPTATPRYLPLDPLRLGLGPATWSDGRHARDGREAVIGIPPGGTSAGVWVDRPGRQTLKFDWSLAGIAELGEQRFELRVPSAATATLSLELPSGEVPTAPTGEALLTGPFPIAGELPRAEWRFRFGGRPRLDFAVRPANNPGVPATASLVARYDISPGQLHGGFEYDLRPAKGTVSEWVFKVDPDLRITDVVVNNRAGWVIESPEPSGGPRTLRVTLHQPGAGGKVLISAVAPFPDSTRPPASPRSPQSPMPCVRPVGANLDDERIEIRLTPGLKPVNWHAGDYRLTDTQVLADLGRSLTLTGTMLPAGTNQPFRRLPALSVAPDEVDFSTVEEIVWRFDVDRAAITARVNLRIRRGTLFQFSLRAPAGYGFIRASATQEDLLSHAESSAGTTTVEFSRPLGAGQSAELTFEFRGPSLAPGRELAFPAFLPVGATERAGVLAILPGPLWVVDPLPGVGAHPAAWLDPTEPRIPSGSAAAYRYRALSPEGSVNVSSVRADFSAETTTAVAALPGGLIGKTMINLRVRSGGLATLLIVESEGGTTQRAWRVVGGGNAVASAVELPTHGLLNPLVRPAGWPGRVAVGGADHPMGRVWLIRFARPVTGAVAVETTALRTLALNALPESIRTARDAFGRWNVPAATPDPIVSPLASPNTVRDSPSTDWRYSGLYLVTAVRSPSDVVVIFGGTIDSSLETSLPVRLPTGAELRAVAIGGRWLEPGSCQLSEEGVARLPLPGNGPVRFEVRYRLPSQIQGPISRVSSREPALPDGPAGPELTEGNTLRRWWVFAGDVLPAWPVRAWGRANPAELPTFLGDSPVAWGNDTLVLRIQLDEVEVGTARLADVTGLAVAVGLVVLVWVSAQRGRPFCALLVVGLLLALGAVGLLGPPWWQRAVSIPLVTGLAGTAVMVIVRGRRAVAPLAAGLLALVHLDAIAQSTSPALVVVLAADAENESGEVVLTPKSVLDRLAPAPVAPGVVLSRGVYSIRVDDAGARVIATYTAHALDEAAGEAIATLPLADARLEKVLVNGSAAYPTAQRQGVYTVPLPGKGRHELEISFAVPLGGTGAERELRFGVPECPTARVMADLPGAARQVQAIGRIGRRSSVDGERVKLEADLGAVKTVHLRWREGTGMGGTASVKVREGCVWDVSESGADLTACYLVRIERGTLGSLQFNIPAELDTMAVVVRSLDLTSTAALRDWTVGKEESGYRPLRIDLQAPVTGQALIVLTCTPRAVVTRQPLLRFPKPELPGGAAEPDAAYGLRTRGLSVEDPGRGGVIDFAPDALLRDFGAVIGRQEPAALIRVFRPVQGRDSQLRPTLRVAGEKAETTLVTTWTIGPRRADAMGTIHWTGKDAPEMLEFVLPGVWVQEVRGADVASWSRSGSRVQVWFRRSIREGRLEWAGTMAVKAAPFAAVTPQITDLRLASDTVELRAAEGYTLTIERDRGWSTLDENDELLVRRTISGDASPVRVLVAPAARTTRVATPVVANAAPPRPSPDPPRPRASPGPIAPSTSPAPDSPGWVRPVSAAALWLLAAGVLGVLLISAPHDTWPEQFGLVAGMLGAVVIGAWWIGFAGWGAARLAWLGDRLLNRPAALMSRE